MSVDWARTKEAIRQQAIAGLGNAARYALGRAQHHAPVRAIFARDRRGTPFPKSFKTMRTADRYRAFLRSKERRRRIDLGEAAKPRTRGMTTTTAGRTIEGRIDVEPSEAVTGAVGAQGERPVRLGRRRFGGSGSAFSGHANSLFPVLRSGQFKFTGDFRRLHDEFGQRTTVGDFVRQRPGDRGRVFREESFQNRGLANPAEAIRASALTSRGRFEVRHARKRGLFGGRVGGRLRGELRVTGPETHGGTVWMYVESPTPYGVHQEFGTRRHRPQPFLRPALYESRNVLRFEVRKAVDPRFNTLPEG